MTRIKICGICRRQDAALAAELGADALGFIGVSGTPRYLTPEIYQEVSAGLPPFVARVIVVQRPEDAAEYGSEYIQHYSDTEVECDAPDARKRIRAFRVRDETSLQELAHHADPGDAVLLDAYHHSRLGGSGETFDWSLAVRAKQVTTRPVMLAGGLTPDNVRAALEAVRPYGVDVSSGVEERPGVKNPAKLRAFIQIIRQWDLDNPMPSC